MIALISNDSADEETRLREAAHDRVWNGDGDCFSPITRATPLPDPPDTN
jgi:hypothetical protein